MFQKRLSKNNKIPNAGDVAIDLLHENLRKKV